MIGQKEMAGSGADQGRASGEVEAGRSARRALPRSTATRTIITVVLVWLGYYFGAQIGFALTFRPHPVSILWPPNAILLAALILSPLRQWWLLLLAAFSAHLLIELRVQTPIAMTLCWYASNSIEAVIGAVSVRSLMGAHHRAGRFDTWRGMSILVLCGAFMAPFLSSFLDAAFVIWNRFGTQGYWQVWHMRFSSNVFASLIVMPTIVLWGSSGFPPWRGVTGVRLLEFAGVFLGLVAVGVIIFCRDARGNATVPALLYIPLPFLLWAAVRFGPTGTSTALLLVAGLAIGGAVAGRGPFVAEAPEQNALSIQGLFGGVTIVLLFLSVSIAERSRAEERFTKAFQSSPDAMLICRPPDGRIIEANDRFHQLFSVPGERLVRRTVGELEMHTSDEGRARLVEGISKTLPFHDLELCLRTRSGELRHTLISADAEEIGGESCLIVILRDITDRRRAEESQQNLAHVSRLAVVGELTAMVAHEVNQPLGAILSNADAAEILLQAEHPPLNQIRDILCDIRRNDLRADESIRRIRALLRKREVCLERLDVNEAASDILRLANGDALRRAVRVHKNFTVPLPEVMADRVHLQQVLLNLVVNAMDAMESVPDTSRNLTIGTRLSESGVEVAVSDSGQGIAPEEISRIFDSFFTTKKEGMGLGLSIARSVIQAHRGRIWAENNPGDGATFRFVLPVENAAGQAPGKVS